MPFMHCTVNGKPGIKWGKHGKCYTGPNAKEKATEQMKAIKSSQEAAMHSKGGKRKGR